MNESDQYTFGTSNYSGTVAQDSGLLDMYGNEYIGSYGGAGTSYYNQTGGLNNLRPTVLVWNTHSNQWVVNGYSGSVTLGNVSGGSGYYNLNGGTLTAGTISVATSGRGGINMGGGTLMFNGNGFTCNAPITLAASTTSVINTNGYGGTTNFAISGDGALTVTGGGTLTLAYYAFHSGLTTVDAGTLAQGIANALPSGTGKGNVAVNAVREARSGRLRPFDQRAERWGGRRRYRG